MKSVYLQFIFLFLYHAATAQIQNVYHPANQFEEIQMQIGTTYNYYDSGGPSGNYSNNENGTLSFSAGGNQNYVIEARFYSLNMQQNGGQCVDELLVSSAQVYPINESQNGCDVCFCGLPAEGTLFFRSFSGGYLEFDFMSNASTTFSGWYAEVRLAPFFEGERCSDATPVLPGTYYQGDDILGYSNDYVTADYTGCYTGTSSFQGKDKVFSVYNELSQPKSLTIRLDFLSDDLDLFIFSDCQGDDLVNCIDFSINGGTQADEVNLLLQPFETIYVVVDAYTSAISQSNFHLYVLDQNNADYCECKLPNFGLGWDLFDCDGSETYNTGQGISSQSANWIVWPGGSDARATANEFKSGQQSIEFTENDDNVFLLGDVTNGRYRLAWDMKVAAGSTGYYNIQHAQSLEHWAYHVYFNSNGTGTVSYGSPATEHNFSYPVNTWFYVVQVIDINTNTIELWINEQFVSTWQFSIGTPDYLNQLGGIDFYGIAGAHFFIDNICYLSAWGGLITCTTDYNPVCVAGGEFNNTCEAGVAGYTECEWEEGPCYDNCAGCSNCFEYHFDLNNRLVFTHESCGLPSQPFNYEWTFPAEANVEFYDGTSASSQNPICGLLPGTWPVCLRYYIEDDDPKVDNGYYECCILVVVPVNDCFDPVPTCGFSVSNNGLNYTFNGNMSTNAEAYSWVVEDAFGFDIPVASGNGSQLSYTFPGTEYCYTVCLYATNGCGFAKKCMTICPTSSPPAASNPEFFLEGDVVSFLNVPSGAEAYNWDVPAGVTFISGNSESESPVCKLPGAGRYVICVEIRLANGYVICCCFTIIYGPGQDPAHIDIGDNVCGPVNSNVLVPVFAYDFVNINAMQLEFVIDPGSAGTFQGIQNQHAGMGGQWFNVPSGSNMTVTWQNPAGNVTLAPGTRLFDLRVRLGSTPNVSGAIHISNGQFVNTNLLEIPYTYSAGSICTTESLYDIAGRVITIDSRGVGNAKVYWTGQASGNTTTNNNGNYAIPAQIGGVNYDITSEKDINDPNGIALEDNFLLFRQVAGDPARQFTQPWQFIAADLNNDGSVNLIDLTILGNIVSGRTNRLDLVDSWFILPVVSYNQLPTNPLGLNINQVLRIQNLSGNMSNADFYAIKMGDLNLDAQEDNISSPLPARRASAVEVSISPEYDKASNEVRAELIMHDLSDIVGFDITLTWDPQYLDFEQASPVAISQFTDVIDLDAGTGRLRVIWLSAQDAENLNFSGDSLIFQLTFDLKEVPESTFIQIEQEGEISFLLNADLQRLPVTSDGAEITEDLVSTSVEILTEESSFNCYPTLLSGNILHLDATGAGVAGEVTVHSVDGREIQREDFGPLSKRELRLRTEEPGVYLVGVKLNGRYHYQRIVKQ